MSHMTPEYYEKWEARFVLTILATESETKVRVIGEFDQDTPIVEIDDELRDRLAERWRGGEYDIAETRLNQIG